MKRLKSISLYFVYPAFMLVLGFWGGARATRFFYPGDVGHAPVREQEAAPQNQIRENVAVQAKEVSQRGETLCVDTEYVLEETDLLRGGVVETVLGLPGKYVGMDREQFLEAMETYEQSPPLSEQERGFVSLEVLAFSRDRVVVQMNYRYLQPGEGFYLAVLDNEVVVLLEDKATIFIYTGIWLESLPQELQEQIIRMKYVEDEKTLYNFLETYSS